MRDEVEAVRRARRVKRVAEEISRNAVLDERNLQVGGFDPNLGASGRPEAVIELPGSRPASYRVVVWLNQEHHWGEKLEWSGTELSVEEAKIGGRKFAIPVASGGTGLLTEVALFASSWGWKPVRRVSDQQTPARIFAGSLHFLDAQGYAFLVVPEVECSWSDLIDVVRATGVPFHAYVLSCLKKSADEITELLFPHRRGCIKVHS